MTDEVQPPRPKPLQWMGSSRKDLRECPEKVRNTVGLALFDAQCGLKNPHAKPLKGFGGAGVLEIVETDDGSTYRAVYTVRFAGFVYVLHVLSEEVEVRHQNAGRGDRHRPYTAQACGEEICGMA